MPTRVDHVQAGYYETTTIDWTIVRCLSATEAKRRRSVRRANWYRYRVDNRDFGGIAGCDRRNCGRRLRQLSRPGESSRIVHMAHRRSVNLPRFTRRALSGLDILDIAAARHN
jgi:hypothetical protein